jgi:hypothetical protein
VRMAAPPNLVGFLKSAGLAAVAYGPDSQKQLDAVPPESLVPTDYFLHFWKIRIRSGGARRQEILHPGVGGDEHDADVVGGRRRPGLTGTTYQARFR